VPPNAADGADALAELLNAPPEFPHLSFRKDKVREAENILPRTTGVAKRKVDRFDARIAGCAPSESGSDEIGSDSHTCLPS
jgi:hypothetical protein